MEIKKTLNYWKKVFKSIKIAIFSCIEEKQKEIYNNIHILIFKKHKLI